MNITRYCHFVWVIFLFANFGRASETNNFPSTVDPFQATGIHNLFSLGKGFYLGSAPEGDAGFEALKKLGVKTIITVDGTKPDLERAHRFGMKFIHPPHGYDGISTKTEGMLIMASETSEGTIFIHCHHRNHCGPAAASIICVSELGWTADQAASSLGAAGIATNYLDLCWQ